jgi:hypothetical protein
MFEDHCDCSEPLALFRFSYRRTDDGEKLVRSGHWPIT